MVNFLFSTAVASIMGMLAGMGVGGGSLLLLWLTQVALIPQQQAKLINLLFFLPAAIISSLFRRKQRVLEISMVIPGIVAGAASAGIFSILGCYLDIEMLKKLLGGLLIITGIRELFYRPRNAK